MKIGNVDTKEKVFVVAEIGNNHEGSFANAEKLVRAAAESGVDAVKFQTFRAKWFTSNVDPARFARAQKFELSFDDFGRLEKLARSVGLSFISTPLDLESADFLEPLVDSFKIASGDNDFWALIDRASKSKKPLIVSTGLSSMDDVKKTRDFITQRRALDDVAFLHCVSAYPAPPAQLNLSAIPLLATELGVTIGYSDHTMGIEASIASVALGARIVEKHFTLDKHFSDFRDHQLSADPDEMKRIVTHVRAVEGMLGKREKSVQEAERPIAPVARRSIVAGSDLARGHRLALQDLTWIRPAGGLRPGEEEKVLGRTLVRDVKFGEKITLADLE